MYWKNVFQNYVHLFLNKISGLIKEHKKEHLYIIYVNMHIYAYA